MSTECPPVPSQEQSDSLSDVVNKLTLYNEDLILDPIGLAVDGLFIAAAPAILGRARNFSCLELVTSSFLRAVGTAAGGSGSSLAGLAGTCGDLLNELLVRFLRTS